MAKLTFSNCRPPQWKPEKLAGLTKNEEDGGRVKELGFGERGGELDSHGFEERRR